MAFGACKDFIPVGSAIRKLSTPVGLDNDFIANLHISIHEHNLEGLTLPKLEPGQMTPWSKHYAIKYHCFVRLSPCLKIEWQWLK